MEPKHLSIYSRISPTLLQKGLVIKTVLITGGGYDTAEQLSNPHKTSTKITFHAIDITTKNEVQDFFENLEAPPDILINNAGFLAAPANFLDVNLGEYWKSFSTSIFGTALVTQAFLRCRQRNGPPATPAVVVTLNTIGAYSARVTLLSSYGASKAALARWSELISADILETVVRFVSVHLGAVKTDMGLKSRLDGVFPNTDPKLAGDFVAWVTSDEARFLFSRLAWVNWDVEELLSKKEEIVTKDLLRTNLSM